ncbi:MAG: alpha/beta hydrolase, partial [Planctomycetia bacterium]|nr:alpha/beta hydrolase [Planctomycetia bacterium]
MSPPSLVSARNRLSGVGASVTVRALAWLALAGATGLLLRAEATRSERPAGVRSYTDLVYREVGGLRLRLDVYVPDRQPLEAGRGRPVVLAIHGGGWRGGSKTDYGRSLAPLVRKGLVVVAPDYRLSAPGEPSWPGNLE